METRKTSDWIKKRSRRRFEERAPAPSLQNYALLAIANCA